MPARLPDLVVIGAPRSGTTTLSHWLRAHPGVAFSHRKEVEFFDLFHDRGLPWYLSQFPEDPGSRCVVEATPTYLSEPGVDQRVAAALPEDRFVAILREPVARAWSPGGTPSSGRSGCTWLLFDDLVIDPLGSYVQICAFAGLDVREPPAKESVNPTRLPRSRRLQRWLQHPQAGSLRTAAYRWNAAGKPVPHLDPAERARLAPQYRDDLAALAVRLGRDLPASWAVPPA